MQRIGQNSYEVENLPHKESELKLLRKRASRRIETFIPLLKARGLTNGKSLLEVATGQGIRAIMAAEHFPNSEVWAIDRSGIMIQEAETLKYEKRIHNVHFQCVDALEMELPLKFDYIYARLFFMHLPDPLPILRNLVRHLAPGGSIIIEDADRDFMKFHPVPKQWNHYWQQVIRGQERSGGDPHVGTKLASYMQRAGLKNVQVDLVPYVSDGKETITLIDDLLVNLNAYLPIEERPWGNDLLKELRELSRKPEAMSYHIWCIITGSGHDLHH